MLVTLSDSLKPVRAATPPSDILHAINRLGKELIIFCDKPPSNPQTPNPNPTKRDPKAPGGMSRSATHDARNAWFRESFSSCEKARAASVPDGKTISSRSQILGLAYDVDDVPESDGARIHWVGDRSSPKVIFYFHGGGYGLSAFDGHVIFLAQCAERLASKGHKTVVAFLEYGLTKVKKYPTQLCQATEGLRHILSEGYKPSDIIVGGDSCGGNLAVGLMSILLHPHPDVNSLSLNSPLAGLLLISPWVSFESDSQSYQDNKNKDIHKKGEMHEWADDYTLPEERNNWSEPIRADVVWWNNLPAKRVLNIYGGFELFKDDDAKFGETLKRAGVEIENIECPLQVHIDCVLDAQSGLETGPMTVETLRWFEKVF